MVCLVVGEVCQENTVSFQGIKYPSSKDSGVMVRCILKYLVKLSFGLKKYIYILPKYQKTVGFCL